jgi:DNA modification methylase
VSFFRKSEVPEHLRKFFEPAEIGLEQTPEAYVARLVEVFREVRRVLRDDGVLWLNVGDSYAGSWGNQGRKTERGTQRPINGPMLTPVHDGRYASKGSRTGAIPSGADYKAKDLLMIPAMVALALRADGWWLRSEVVWHKPNPMPESIRDRPTQAHEKVFLLAKSQRYFYDADAIAEPFETDPRERYEERARITGRGDQGFAAARGRDRGKSGGFPPPAAGLRNARNVWRITTKPSGVAHFATMPRDLAERCIKAGSRTGDTVLDPFGGAGTTALAAQYLGRDAILCELNPDYAALATERLRGAMPVPAETPPLLAAMAAE